MRVNGQMTRGLKCRATKLLKSIIDVSEKIKIRLKIFLLRNIIMSIIIIITTFSFSFFGILLPAKNIIRNGVETKPNQAVYPNPMFPVFPSPLHPGFELLSNRPNRLTHSCFVWPEN